MSAGMAVTILEVVKESVADVTAETAETAMGIVDERAAGATNGMQDIACAAL